MEQAKYSAPLRALHWIVGLLVLLVWPLGYLIKFVDQSVKLDFYLLHESFGFMVFWFMLMRALVRSFSKQPAPETGLEGAIARTVHLLLYGALILMPVSGFLATNAHGFPLQLFGLVPIWSPVGKDPEVAPVFSAVHEWVAWILLGLFALHMAGVLFHHLIKRDNILYRML
ncbi:cytochrome b [Rhizobium helianthi]|uniref:Cytochrome b n=1 Tax=Rhizobium helianthi TaxID=1132695 RepID=A0ABW4M2G4_9HYPH